MSPQAGVEHLKLTSLSIPTICLPFLHIQPIQYQRLGTLDPNPIDLKLQLYRPDKEKSLHMFQSRGWCHYQFHHLLHHLQKVDMVPWSSRSWWWRWLNSGPNPQMFQNVKKGGHKCSCMFHHNRNIVYRLRMTSSRNTLFNATAF